MVKEGHGQPTLPFVIRTVRVRWPFRQCSSLPCPNTRRRQKTRQTVAMNEFARKLFRLQKIPLFNLLTLMTVV